MNTAFGIEDDESLKGFAARFAAMSAFEPPAVVHEVAGHLSYRLADELEGSPMGEAVRAAMGDGSRFAVFFDSRPNSWRFKFQRTPELVQAFEASSELEAVRAVLLLDSAALFETCDLVRLKNPYLLAAFVDRTGAFLDWCRAFDGSQCDGVRVLGDVAAVLDWAAQELEPATWSDEARFGARAAAFTALSCHKVLQGHAAAMLDGARRL